MPRPHPRTGALAMGIAGGPASIQGREIAAVGGGCQWLDDETVVFGAPEGVCAYHVPTKARRVLDPRTPNGLSAGGGQWIAFRPDTGVYGSLNNAIAGLTRDAVGIGAAAPDGTLAITPVYKSGGGLQLHHPNGKDIRDIPGAVFWDPHIVSYDGVIWDGLDGHCYVDGLEAPLEFGDLGMRFRYVPTPEGPWIVYDSRRWGVVARPAQSREGVRMTDYSGVAGAMFYHDAVWTDRLGLCVTWSVGAGELPHEGVWLPDVQTLPRVDLTPPVEIPPVNKTMWLGWYNHKQPPIDYPPFPGNCSMNVYEGGLIKRRDTGEAFAQWVTGSSVEAIEQAVHASARPCFAYWDALDWPRWPQLRPQDWLGLQAYCRKDWTPERFEQEILRRITAAPAGVKLALTCQVYTSNAALTTDLASLVPVFARLAQRVDFLLDFNDYGRAGGLQDHPEVRPLWEQVAATILIPPQEDDMPLNPPGINIIKWTPVFDDTFELVWTDRNNPSLGTTRVTREHGSIRIEVTMESGHDKTGASRPVNCPSAPVPPDPVPPDPIPPDPQPEPEPPKPGDQINLKSVAWGSYWNRQADTTLKAGGGRISVVVEDHGGRVAALKTSTGYVACDPVSGVLTANRGTPDITGWEGYDVVDSPVASSAVGFRAKSNHKFIRDDGNGTLRATAGALGDQESFLIEPAQAGGGTGAQSGPLSVSGRRVLTEDGQPWFGVGITAFPLQQLWLDNQSAALEMIDRAVSRGVQWFRVFGMYNGGIGRFIPAEYGQRYFTGLRDLAEALAARARRMQFVVYADCQNAPLTFDPAFFSQVAAVLQGTWNVILSGGNEMPFNGFDAGVLTKPSGMLSCRCSMGTDATPYTPPWDMAPLETARDDYFEKAYKAVYDCYVGNTNPPPTVINAAILIDEMIGIGEVYESGRTTNDPFKCFQLTAGAKIMGAVGICAHIRDGIKGLFPAPGSLGERCVDAMVAAGALPLGDYAFDEYQRGLSPGEGQNSKMPIIHNDVEPNEQGYPGDPAGSLRTHAMIRGNQCEVIAPGPGPNYHAQEAHGWHIVESFAFEGKPVVVHKCQK